MAKTWGDAGLYLVLWHCGDEDCDCWQVQVEQRARDRRLLALLWSGELVSRPEAKDWAGLHGEFEWARAALRPDFAQEVDWPDCALDPKAGDCLWAKFSALTNMRNARS